MKFVHRLLEAPPIFRNSLIIIAVFIAGFALGNLQGISYAQSSTSPPRDAEPFFEPFWQVYNLIRSDYLDRSAVTTESLVDGAIRGMLDSLGDQFSGYMDPQTFPMMNNDLSGEVEGIGAVVETIEETDEVRIVNVLEGSPAEAAGLQSGDIFVAVDGQNVTGMSQLDLVSKVRGPEGTTVNLTMRRGDELLEFSIVRARITVPAVEYERLEGDLGYIKLRDFSVNAYDQLNEALTALDVGSLKGLVLDLRGNPGGLLSSAIDVASTFIKEGSILIEDFGGGRDQEFKTNGRYFGSSLPMVVLVDNNSASASEIVAGALQDNGRATIIGVTTFGKGTVQTWQELVNGGGIRLTIARWLTPNGNWIHGQGITPDIIVEWDRQTQPAGNAYDPQLMRALELLRSHAQQGALNP